MTQKLFFSFSLFLLVTTLNAQNKPETGDWGVSYYSSNVVGINANIMANGDNKLAAEIKVFTNRNVRHLGTEIDIFWKFKEKEYHHIAIGAGLLIDYIIDDAEAGITLPISLQVMPFQSQKRLSLMMELAPVIYFDDDVALRSLIGVRYQFGKISKR